MGLRRKSQSNEISSILGLLSRLTFQKYEFAKQSGGFTHSSQRVKKTEKHKCHK